MPQRVEGLDERGRIANQIRVHLGVDRGGQLEWSSVCGRRLGITGSRSRLMLLRGCGVEREAHGPWRRLRTGDRVLILGGDRPAASPPVPRVPHIPPTADPPEGDFLMPVLTPGNEE